MASPSNQSLRRPMARTRRYERRNQGSNPCGGSSALPSSRPGDDASLLRRTSSVRGRGRQPTPGRLDFWRGPRPRILLNCAEETGSIPVPSTSARRVGSSLAERQACTQEPAGSWPAPRPIFLSPWCSTAARRSPKPKDAVQIRAGMPHRSRSSNGRARDS